MDTKLTLEEIRTAQIDVLKHVVAICNKHHLRYYLICGTLLGAVRHNGFIPWDDDIDVALPRGDFDKLESICRANPSEPYGWFDYKDDFRIPNNIAKVCDRRTILFERVRDYHRVPLGVNIDIFVLDGVPAGYVAKRLHLSRIEWLKRLMAISAINNSEPRLLYRRCIIALVQRLMSEPLLRTIHELLERAIRRYEYDSSEYICNCLSAWARKEWMPKIWIGSGTSVAFEGLYLGAFSQYDNYLSKVYGEYWKLPPAEEQKSHHRYEAFRVG